MALLERFFGVGDYTGKVIDAKPKAINKPKGDPLERHTVNVMTVEQLAEYSELARELKVATPDLTVELLKRSLLDLNITVFSLAEVITYMDHKARMESHERAGWEWVPLRRADHMERTTFGRAAERGRDHYGAITDVTIPASDYYGSGNRADIYGHTVPIHALKKVAAIEAVPNLTGRVAFLVSDYALAPAIEQPDPFLMVMPKEGLHNHRHRYVIDFWDEPGFGIEQQLKTDLA